MSFRRLSDDFVSGSYPGKSAYLEVALAEQLERVVQDLAGVGMISGHDTLKVLDDFGEKGHVCCVVQGTSPIGSIEIDGPLKIWVLFRSVKL